MNYLNKKENLILKKENFLKTKPKAFLNFNSMSMLSLKSDEIKKKE